MARARRGTGTAAVGRRVGRFPVSRRLPGGDQQSQAAGLAAAFFPQFIDRSQPQAPQFAILVATFCVLELFWYAVYALGGRTFAGYLSRPAWQRGFDRATGVVFVGFGLALLKFRPS